MEKNLINSCYEEETAASQESIKPSCISLETEIPEVLYQGLKEFIGSNPNWDQYRVFSSALAHFLFLNGCSDRAVSERYLNDLFSRSEA